MRLVSIAAGSLLVSLLMSDAIAQGGGRMRGRPEEITNRTGAFFTDVAGPQSDGDKVADLATIELVRAAKGANQPVVLYLYDSGDDQDTRDQFDRSVFAGDELGIELKCFHCGRIDLGKEAALKTKYGKQAPLFVVFDGSGKPSELSMAGYKASASALGKLLEKQSSGTVKPSLAAFAKSYGDIVHDLEQLLAKKKQAQQKQAKAGGDAQKHAAAEKEIKSIEAEEQKVLDKEKDLLGKVRLPERDAKAQRLGGFRWGGRGPGGGAPGGGTPGGGAPGGDTPGGNPAPSGRSGG